ncbi:MAG: hypothetical protein KF832_11920 [Caldilineaceae bacterium]|nr:hypothetical protein [Caldilineaceae bacterium]
MMYTMDVDTLTTLQRERYQEFQRQAELLRLVRQQQSNQAVEPVGNVTTPQQPVQVNVLTALQQLLRSALQTHIRAVR